MFFFSMKLQYKEAITWYKQISSTARQSKLLYNTKMHMQREPNSLKKKLKNN